jgi:hypothetical protein
MFLPQVAEVDQFDKSGKQTDDINSLVELIRVKLGYDHTADDEDDDNGMNFHLVKVVDYYFEQKVVCIEPVRISTLPKKIKFPEYKEKYTSTHSLEITTPPPDFI